MMLQGREEALEAFRISDVNRHHPLLGRNPDRRGAKGCRAPTRRLSVGTQSMAQPSPFDPSVQ